jgi:hypothetical protein
MSNKWNNSNKQNYKQQQMDTSSETRTTDGYLKRNSNSHNPAICQLFVLQKNLVYLVSAHTVGTILHNSSLWSSDYKHPSFLDFFPLVGRIVS